MSTTIRVLLAVITASVLVGGITAASAGTHSNNYGEGGGGYATSTSAPSSTYAPPTKEYGNSYSDHRKDRVSYKDKSDHKSDYRKDKSDKKSDYRKDKSDHRKDYRKGKSYDDDHGKKYDRDKCIEVVKIIKVVNKADHKSDYKSDDRKSKFQHKGDRKADHVKFVKVVKVECKDHDRKAKHHDDDNKKHKAHKKHDDHDKKYKKVSHHKFDNKKHDRKACGY